MGFLSKSKSVPACIFAALLPYIYKYIQGVHHFLNFARSIVATFESIAHLQEVETLTKELKSRGIAAGAYHAQLEPNYR